jgi:sigma-B regulation protein RsbU (phosphoserine phosphatase)
VATEAFYEALLDDDVEELYEYAPCGYLSTTPDGLIVKVNGTFLTWTGLRRDDLVGRLRFADLLTKGGQIFHETHYAPMLRLQGRVREIAVEIVRADGERLSVLVNAVVKRGADGEPLVIRTAVFDATERREYERELLLSRQRAVDSETRARVLAETLQASLIPPDMPRVPGLDVAGAYRPAGRGDEVGGDFYDVFETGRNDWAAVLGDVCGKGAPAAAVTALARYTVRAAAMKARSPRAVLTTLNQAVLRQHPERFCTAVYVRIRTDAGNGGGCRVSVCSAGHLLPLRVGPSEPVGTVGREGTLLGAFDEIVLHDTNLSLSPGEVLVLYTDGITEARSASGEFYGNGRLEAVLEETRTEPSAVIAERIVADAVAFQGGHAADDAAVLVLKVPG